MPTLNPYLSFRSNAREALEFYHAVLGGELEVMAFGTMPDLAHSSDELDLVMHGSVTTEDGMVLMASDTPSDMTFVEPQGISISIGGAEADRLRQIWNALLDGGTATMPLGPAPWGGEFGMLTDRFGIGWMISIDG